MRVFETKDWQQVQSFVHPGGAEGMAFNADATRIATGGPDHTLRIWDVELGKELLALPVAKAPIVSIIWDHSNDRIYTLDDALRVWGK